MPAQAVVAMHAEIERDCNDAVEGEQRDAGQRRRITRDEAEPHIEQQERGRYESPDRTEAPRAAHALVLEQPAELAGLETARLACRVARHGYPPPREYYPHARLAQGPLVRGSSCKCG